MGTNPLIADRNAANRANERRYERIIGELEGLRSRSTGVFDAALAAEQAATERRFEQMQGTNRAEMIRRGFGNSTALATMAAGIQRQRSTALAEVAAVNAGRRFDADMRTTGMLTGAIERREDVGPNLGAYAQAAYQSGRASVPVAEVQPPAAPRSRSSGGSSGGGGYRGSAFRNAVRRNFEDRREYREGRGRGDTKAPWER